jgi:hypothetical protein
MTTQAIVDKAMSFVNKRAGCENWTYASDYLDGEMLVPIKALFEAVDEFEKFKLSLNKALMQYFQTFEAAKAVGFSDFISLSMEEEVTNAMSVAMCGVEGEVYDKSAKEFINELSNRGYKIVKTK